MTTALFILCPRGCSEDLKLPKKTSFEILERLRGQSKLCRIPVVFLTSSDETSDIDRAYKLGANSYLVKPVAFGTLVEMIKALELYWIKYNKSCNTSAE